MRCGPITESELHNKHTCISMWDDDSQLNCPLTCQPTAVLSHTPHLMLGQFTEATILSQGQLSVVAFPAGAKEVAHVVEEGADAMATMNSPQSGGGGGWLLVAMWQEGREQENRVRPTTVCVCCVCVCVLCVLRFFLH